MNSSQRERLVLLGRSLVDQDAARVVVEPNARQPGFWFGGGNIVQTADGVLHIVGRYRNVGDSTTGLGKGDRGLELAIFSSEDGGATFTRSVSLTKTDLSRTPGEVVSIEGAALNPLADGIELFISTEKSTHPYPRELASFQKPGTGVWTIDRMVAGSVAELAHAEAVPLLSSDIPGHLHVKDPVVHTAADGRTVLIFCTHPFGWSSSNSACCVRPAGANEFGEPEFNFFSRGLTWDVAATRITDVLSIDGALLGEAGSVQLVFYDGAECLRPHDENPAAVSRPRGYSCEELGGLACTVNDRYGDIQRLSLLTPFFVSPHGSGSSRYVHTTTTEEGAFATWQQAQADGSQPLVMNFLDWDEIKRILAG